MGQKGVFLPTTHMLPPHIKRKKCKRKFYSLPHENTTHRREERKELQQRKKRERRERRRRKKEDHGAESGRPPRPSAGSRRPWVSQTHGMFFFFFFPFRWFREGSRRKDETHGWVSPEGSRLPPDTSRPTHRPSRPTAGSRRPWVWFFFFFLPVWFFFLVFRMINFQIGLTFPSRF